MKTMLLVVGIAVAGLAAPCQAGDTIPIAGMWDDGLVGENTMISLSTNGTGDVISLACFEIRWTVDAKTKVLSMTYIRQKDQKEETLRLSYDPKSDKLIGKLYGTSDIEHVFRRASQEKVNWWAGVKKGAANHTSDGIRQPADGSPKPSR